MSRRLSVRIIPGLRRPQGGVGEAGEVGEEGTGGGGRGGHGGRGGRGGIGGESWTERLCLVALIVAAVLSTYAIKTAQTADSNARKIGHDAQQLATLEGKDAMLETKLLAVADNECARVQALRVRVNANSAAIHRSLNVIATILVEPSLLRTLAPIDRRQRERATAILRAQTHLMRREARTDCIKARDPSYRPPHPRPFKP